MSDCVAGGTPGSTPDVSVVLPAYQAAAVAQRQVPVLQEFLARIGVPHEVILVDDGSDDDGATAEVARRLGVTYLVQPTNQGKGAAVRRGMRAARGRYRLYTDIDVPYDLASLESVLWYLSFKEYDMVAGDRTLANSSYFHRVPVARQLASKVYSTLVGRFLVGGWFDTQCGLKGFAGPVADDLFSVARIDRFAFDVELFYLALKRNYDIKRVPVRLRVNETSSIHLARDGAAMVRDLGVMRLHQLLGHYQPVVPVHHHGDTTPRPFRLPRDTAPEERR